MTAYYNEIDPFKAEVLREAVEAGAIAPGDVDERSIADVRPDELRGYRQCHFFAGGGFWSLALRQAGWPDDREVWTGSCPCPSFSAAGKGQGFADARHLWPDWHRLIRECRPPVVFGEQVAAAIGHGWLDLVCGEMEAEKYAIAAAVLGAHSAGAPHIRQRLYFCADTTSSGYDGWRSGEASSAQSSGKRRSSIGKPERLRDVGQRADSDGRQSSYGDLQRSGEQRLLPQDNGTSDVREADERGLAMCGSAPGNAGHAAQSGEPERSLYADSSGCEAQWDSAIRPRERAETVIRSSVGERDNPIGKGLEGHFGDVREWRGPGWLDPLTARSVAETGATRGFWADCDWWYGRDEKYRPIGPGIQPLAHGVAARVGRLRLYGDAICVPAAQAFIEAYLTTDH